VADITELLRACLRLLELPVRERVYRPNPPPLWRVPDALARLRGALAGLPAGGVPLAALLPGVAEGVATPLQRRAATASTLMAGLELTREGELALKQHAAFGEIRVGRPAPPHAAGVDSRQLHKTAPPARPGVATQDDDGSGGAGAAPAAPASPARAASRSPAAVRR
jgi:hypothetical protein